MVNANIVISVSAVLVALVLTLVVLMRQEGDPTSNFSVQFKGSYSESGSTYGTEMYYCTGASCRFYPELSAEDDFPGYFALVAFEDSASGEKFVTEHSIGQTFVFKADGTLKECRPAMDLDGTSLDGVVSSLSSAWDSESKSFDMGDGVTYTLSSYVLDSDPSDDTPTVLGVTIPTPAQCQAAAGETFNTLNTDTSCATCEDASRRNLESGVVEEVPAPEQGVRHLAVDGNTFADLCSFGYDGASSLPSGWTETKSCINANAVARLARHISSGVTVASFAGTNDFSDVIQDMKIWGHSVYHGGFYDYTMMLHSCVTNGGGRDATYIVGHSLGGAAATVYRRIASASGTVVTFGAPKTTKVGSCSVPGMRIFNEKDPVASNGMGIMGSLNHDVKTSKRAYFQSGSCAKRHWMGWCTRYNSDVHGITGGTCGEVATGCSWLFDCMYNVGRHSLDTYRKHSLGAVSI